MGLEYHQHRGCGTLAASAEAEAQIPGKKEAEAQIPRKREAAAEAEVGNLLLLSCLDHHGGGGDGGGCRRDTPCAVYTAICCC